LNSNNFRKENLRTLRTSILQVPKVTQRSCFHSGSGLNTSHTSLSACKSGVRKLRSRTEKVLSGYGVIGSTYTCVNSERKGKPDIAQTG
jgi:hypothetical protein